MEKREDLLDKLKILSKQTYKGYEDDKSLKMLEWFVKKYNLLDDAISKKNQIVHRGEIYWCELGENIGCEEVKLRPCVIIQNEKGNINAPTTIVAPITNAKINLPVAVHLDRGNDSVITGTIDLGQIRVISKGRIKGHISNLKTSELKQVNKAILSSLGLYKYYKATTENGIKIKTLSNEVRVLSNLLLEIKKELNIENDIDILQKIKDLKS